MDNIKINSKIIGSGQPVYIISEIGSNFDHDFARAKSLAKLSKDLGADAFKIQNFLAPKIVSAKGFDKMQVAFQAKWKSSVTEVYRQAEFPREWLKDLMAYCQSIGIDFLSSPYDTEAVDLLLDLGAAAYKIGSGEIDNLEFLQYVAKTGKPIILGCGAATMPEIKSAVAAIKNTGNDQLILLQCVTNYPSPVNDANIRAMAALKNEFDLVVGYSDHTIGQEGGGDDPLSGLTVPLGAVALGAAVIEKHFTDDRKRQGPDHPFAMDPESFGRMVKGVRAMEKALGSGKKELAPSEKETVIIQRRGLYAKTEIEAGDKITKEKIEWLRPAAGLKPAQLNEALGKTAKRNILAGEAIRAEDIY